MANCPAPHAHPAAGNMIPSRFGATNWETPLRKQKWMRNQSASISDMEFCPPQELRRRKINRAALPSPIKAIAPGSGTVVSA